MSQNRLKTTDLFFGQPSSRFLGMPEDDKDLGFCSSQSFPLSGSSGKLSQSLGSQDLFSEPSSGMENSVPEVTDSAYEKYVTLKSVNRAPTPYSRQQGRKENLAVVPCKYQVKLPTYHADNRNQMQMINENIKQLLSDVASMKQNLTAILMKQQEKDNMPKVDYSKDLNEISENIKSILSVVNQNNMLLSNLSDHVMKSKLFSLEQFQEIAHSIMRENQKLYANLERILNKDALKENIANVVIKEIGIEVRKWNAAYYEERLEVSQLSKEIKSVVVTKFSEISDLMVSLSKSHDILLESKVIDLKARLENIMYGPKVFSNGSLAFRNSGYVGPENHHNTDYRANSSLPGYNIGHSNIKNISPSYPRDLFHYSGIPAGNNSDSFSVAQSGSTTKLHYAESDGSHKRHRQEEFESPAFNNEHFMVKRKSSIVPSITSKFSTTPQTPLIRNVTAKSYPKTQLFRVQKTHPDVSNSMSNANWFKDVEWNQASLLDSDSSPGITVDQLQSLSFLSKGKRSNIKTQFASVGNLSQPKSNSIASDTLANKLFCSTGYSAARQTANETSVCHRSSNGTHRPTPNIHKSEGYPFSYEKENMDSKYICQNSDLYTAFNPAVNSNTKSYQEDFRNNHRHTLPQKSSVSSQQVQKSKCSSNPTLKGSVGKVAYNCVVKNSRDKVEISPVCYSEKIMKPNIVKNYYSVVKHK